MASKDFIYDLLDKLEEDQTEYLLLTFSRGEEEDFGDLFFNFYHEESHENASAILKKLSKVIKDLPEGEDIKLDLDLNDDDEDEDER